MLIQLQSVCLDQVVTVECCCACNMKVVELVLAPVLLSKILLSVPLPLSITHYYALGLIPLATITAILTLFAKC